MKLGGGGKSYIFLGDDCSYMELARRCYLKLSRVAVIRGGGTRRTKIVCTWHGRADALRPSHVDFGDEG